MAGCTGILISSSDDKSTELLYGRRSETQADCFSGMFMRGIALWLGLELRCRLHLAPPTAPSGHTCGKPSVEVAPLTVGQHRLGDQRRRTATRSPGPLTRRQASPAGHQPGAGGPAW